MLADAHGFARPDKTNISTNPGGRAPAGKHLLSREVFFAIVVELFGALAHLARALPWHGRGDRFESDMLHHSIRRFYIAGFFRILRLC